MNAGWAELLNVLHKDSHFTFDVDLQQHSYRVKELFGCLYPYKVVVSFGRVVRIRVRVIVSCLFSLTLWQDAAQ